MTSRSDRSPSSTWNVSLVVGLISLLVYYIWPFKLWNLSTSFTEPWASLDVRSLVVFGDSYTDEGRLNWFIEHSGSAPPSKTIFPPNIATSSGGYVWARYATWYLSTSSAHAIELYNYAVSGAVCSNLLVSRFFPPIRADFPDVEGYEVPAFIADVKAREDDDSPFIDANPDHTVYAIWIGTNDLGRGCFLSDAQAKGTTLVDYLDCVYRQIDHVYASPVNGRYLVLFNVVPLEKAPMYQLVDISGLEVGYLNATETHERMSEQVALVNHAYEWRSAGEVMIKKRYPGMHLAVFNVHDLLDDVHENPARHLNGTAPADVYGTVNQCQPDCIRSESPDSYLWFDGLHPSEQAHRVIAKEFVHVVSGKSKYASYYS